MLTPRITVALTMQDGGLVHTSGFEVSHYLGDPLNAIRVFGEFEVDEIVLFDITTKIHERPLNYALLEKIGKFSTAPLCYGGGIASVSQAVDIIGMGFEKVSLSSAFFDDHTLLESVSDKIGMQSTVLTLDVRRVGWKQDVDYEVWSNSKKYLRANSLIELLHANKTLQIGEIIFNHIDRDGSRKGYDLELAKLSRDLVNLPVTLLGGAGSPEHFEEVFQLGGCVSCAASTIFTHFGKKDAVLLNYFDGSLREGIAHWADSTVGV